MSRRLAWLACAAVLGLPVQAQVIHTYTESQGGGTNLPLGYPVPLPVASLEPVDGFRDYASIEARLQGLALSSDDLAAHQVGTTQQYARPLWAYRASDPDGSDWEGAPEPAFYINAGIHAREWGTPEIGTGLLERMVAGAGDGGMVRYLLDNTALVVVPVHNIDGFLQTQRYPTRVLVGSDPRYPQDWPRDGRMRRKNMRGADEVLETTADHLNGIDLNRNHPPYWATTPGYSSSDPADLVYHGGGPHSEAESQALVQALLLAPPERLRMAADIHSFAQVFFSSNTNRPRLNAIQTLLLTRVAAHHRVVSRPPGGFDGTIYSEFRDPPNSGGGLAAEYFAHEYLVPAWTLEIEPTQSGAQYGGTGEGHSGFILPAAEVRRVREAWAESHVVAFYYMAGAPFLAEVRILDAATGVQVSRQQWQRQGTQRQRLVDGDGTLQPGRSYRAELVFSKPMRLSIDGAAPGGFPGQAVVPAPTLALLGAGQEIALDSAAGSWRAQGRRYAYDTFVVEFDAPGVPGEYVLRVEARDAVGHRLDADPSTPVDWVEGAWSGLEGAVGAGDEGGPDVRTQFAVQATELSVLSLPTLLGEGDLAQVVLRRQGGTAALSARLSIDAAATACAGVADAVVEWNAGELGDRSLPLCIADDLAATGTRNVPVAVQSAAGSATFADVSTATLLVLDNDLPAQSVVRVRDQDGLKLAMVALQEPHAAVEIVLDHGEIALTPSPFPACPGHALRGPATVFGNHATVRQDGPSNCAVLDVVGTDPVTLRQLRLLARPLGEDRSIAPALAGEAPLLLESVHLDDGGPGAGTQASDQGLLQAEAALTLRRTAISGLERAVPAAVAVDGALAMESSSLVAEGAATLLDLRQGADGAIASSTLVPDGGDVRAIRAGSGSSVALAGSLLQQQGSGVLCSGDTDSLGHNVASDTSCGQAGSDRTPRTVPVQALDALTGTPLPAGDAIDIGGDCPPVDLRGAPRPQASEAGATALCDAGAIELGINPYRGLWIPDRPGHGIDIHTAGNVLFLTWYTYHPDGSPAAYQAAAPLTGPVWSARLDSARRNADGSTEVFAAGEIELHFSSDTTATLRWRIGEATEWGQEGLQAYFFAAGEPRVEASGTWYDASDPGWGVTVTRRGAITGVVLYYYDGEGTLRWALAQGGDGDALQLELLGFTGFCPDCDAGANPVQSAPVGSLQLQFYTPVRARTSVDAGYGGGARFQREATLSPLNDPVDNRRAAAQGDAGAAAGL